MSTKRAPPIGAARPEDVVAIMSIVGFVLRRPHTVAAVVNPIHRGFEYGFGIFRKSCRNTVAWTLTNQLRTVGFFLVLVIASLLLFPALGRELFPQVDADQMRLRVHSLPGSRIEQTQADFARVEAAIREIVGNDQIGTIFDTIGLPYSGPNFALSDPAMVGTMGGEILIALKPDHAPTTALVARLRRALSERFAQLQFFFQPADIVDQVLNFGEPAPIDIRVSGQDDGQAYALAAKLARDLQRAADVVDPRAFQGSEEPTLNNTKRSKPLLMNLPEFDREKTPLVKSQVNIRPVFDVQANVEGRDFASAAFDIDNVIAAELPTLESTRDAGDEGSVPSAPARAAQPER